MNAASARLLDLVPTQFALGMVQVRSKMAQTRQVPAIQRDAFMHKLAIAVVCGPGGRLHVIDHHHWSRAWIELGIEAAPVHIKADFADLETAGFLRKMDEHGWIHPYNERGEKVPIDTLPVTVADMPDDPYQSLAAFLRVAGVYENPGEFNAKFAWADYLRKRVTGNPATIEGFAEMLAAAYRVAHTGEARLLPGYRGGDRAAESATSAGDAHA
ncbi:ParB-like protein [Paraburkholderia terrae]